MSVTEQDKKRAVALLRAAAADGLIEATEPRHQPAMVERIAAALAEERERARAPFLAYADKCAEVGADRKSGIFKRAVNRAVAAAFRQVAEESQ